MVRGELTIPARRGAGKSGHWGGSTGRTTKMKTMPIERPIRVALILAGLILASAAAAQAPARGAVTFKQVAPDLYFLF